MQQVVVISQEQTYLKQAADSAILHRQQLFLPTLRSMGKVKVIEWSALTHGCMQVRAIYIW
jgi:hypothetical protein